MIEADRVPSTPPLPASEFLIEGLPAGLLAQEQERKKSIRDLARLRKEASAEIDRLISFLDASDVYVMTELEDQADDEPSLGSGDDRELDDSDGEAGCDDEPSLGSLDHNHTQEQWAAGGRRDMEEDPAEAGIGDQDGLDEQHPFRDWQMVGMV